MNPDNVIRPWLLAVGAQFGIREAYLFKNTDADSATEVLYFEYRPISITRLDVQPMNRSTSTLNTVHSKFVSLYSSVYEINLYNSPGGMSELGACEIAATKIPSITGIFKSHGVSVHDVQPIIDDSEVTDEEVRYKQTMTVEFYENVSVSIDQVNGFVDTIKWNLEDGSVTYAIDSDGISVE